MVNSLCNIRLGSSEAGLSRGYIIHSLGIPKPTQPIYNDHSVQVALSDGGVAKRGWPSIILLWDDLTVVQVRVLREIVDAAITAGYLYVTADKSWNGSEGLGYWVDFRGRPALSDSPPSPGTSGLLRENISLTIDNLETVNDPASF